MPRTGKQDFINTTACPSAPSLSKSKLAGNKVFRQPQRRSGKRSFPQGKVMQAVKQCSSLTAETGMPRERKYRFHKAWECKRSGEKVPSCLLSVFFPPAKVLFFHRLHLIQE